MEKLDLFRNLMVMAAIDGAFTQGEMEMLADWCAMWGIEDEDFEEALKHALSPDAELSIPNDQPSQIVFLKECLRLMAADGELTEPEKQLFSIAAAQIKITDEHLNKLIDDVLASDN
ncbi:MAG: hypothetical protein VB878_25010 [Pirellulaceae bacterium]